MDFNNELDIEDIEVGMSASYSQTMTDSDIKSFAGISGDKNPIHISDKYIEKSRFKKRVVHGMLVTSFFSALFGSKLPGTGCLYVSQNINFKLPIYINDTVEAVIKVISVDKKARKVMFQTLCKVKERIVIDGNAVIYIRPKTREKNTR